MNAHDTTRPTGHSNRDTTDDKDGLTDGGSRIGSLVDRITGLTGEDDTTDDRPDPSAGLDIDTLLDQLASERRRLVIRALADQTESIQIGEMSRQIAAHQNGCEPEDVTSVQRKRVYVSLYQNHLELLDDVDLVDYEKESGTINGTPETEVAAAVLHDLDERLGGGR